MSRPEGLRSAYLWVPGLKALRSESESLEPNTGLKRLLLLALSALVRHMGMES